MMDYKKTYTVLDVLYESCFAFWLGEGNDDYSAHTKALMDVEGVLTNPFSPLGETLNPDAKAKFIKDMEWTL